MENKFLTVEDLTKPPWNFSQNKAYRLVKAKGFPAVKDGGTYTILAWKLEEYFEKNVGKEIIPPRQNYK